MAYIMAKVLSTMLMEINNTKVNLKMTNIMAKVLSMMQMDKNNTRVNLKIT